VLGSLLVDIGSAVVLLLVDLVTDGVLGGGGTGAEGGVAVLGNLLVALLGGSGESALNGLRDVVGGVVDLVHCDGWGGLCVKVVGCVCGRCRLVLWSLERPRGRISECWLSAGALSLRFCRRRTSARGTPANTFPAKTSELLRGDWPSRPRVLVWET